MVSRFCIASVFACVALLVVPLLQLGRLPKLEETPHDSSNGHLSQRAVVITGGTGGLGLAVARRLASRPFGDFVFVCGRSASRVEAAKSLERWHAGNGGIHASVCDVSNEASVKSFFDVVRQQLKDLGRSSSLDVLVNNAGILQVGDPILAMDTSTFDATLGVNVRGVFLTTREAWPLLNASTQSSPLIVNIGSTTEVPQIAQAFHSIYTISKNALRAMSVGMRQEAAILRPGTKVLHLRVGSFESGLHSAFTDAGPRLAAYPEPFGRHAPSLVAHLKEALAMVHEAPADEFSAAMEAIIHPRGGVSAVPDELWLHVSFLERLVAWLPQPLLDYTIISKFI